MYKEDNVSSNEETLSSNFKGDPIDESIEGPIELLMISTCKVWKSISATKEILQDIKDTLNYCLVTDISPYSEINFYLTVQVVTLELNNTQPADVTINPVPYSLYNPFQEKIKKTYELLQGAPSPTERLLATQSISDYYKRVSIRARLWTHQAVPVPGRYTVVAEQEGVYYEEAGLGNYQVNIPTQDVFWDPHIIERAPSTDRYVITIPAHYQPYGEEKLSAPDIAIYPNLTIIPKPSIPAPLPQ
ncbi:5750_t:CDS:2, partial [Gigaspora margarita]